MGKRQIGEMQPFELVITLLIADLACIPMSDISIPLLYGIVSIITIYLLHQIVCLLDLKFKYMKKLFSGSPSVVINKDGIDVSQLKKNNLDVSDLVESLRGAGYFSLDAVDYALYEANGSFTALPKEDYEKKQNSLPVILIDFGKIIRHNLYLIGKDELFIKNIMIDNNCKKLKNILAMTIDGNGKIYLQIKGQKYKVFYLDEDKKLW